MRWLASLVVMAACGSEDPTCRTSYLNYDNFGAPFMTSWCDGCHGEAIPPGMRQGANADVNFDTLDEVRQRGAEIVQEAGKSHLMPPAGGPTDAEREMLVEWVTCGAR